MKINIVKFYKDGTMEFIWRNRKMISRSPIGMVVYEETLYAPCSADIAEGRIVLHYEVCEVELSTAYRENGSVRLEVVKIPDDMDRFIFGPYLCPEAIECGEALGAAWFDDQSVVCIQSLNPKTIGGVESDVIDGNEIRFINNTSFPMPGNMAAVREQSSNSVLMQCSARNMSKGAVRDFLNMKNVIVESLEGADAEISGAAVVLTAAPNGQELLDDLCRLELEEGLPHPTIDGEWAKTSPKATEIYFTFAKHIDREEQLNIAARAGVHCVYFGNPFKSWGHFLINEQDFPGGEEEFAAFIKEAAKRDINIGFHTLSNFIHVDDAYVTPVPHPDLLIQDNTVLTVDIDEQDNVLYIADANNYMTKSKLQVVKIDNEMIHYTEFDKQAMCLIGCERGAFGTAAACHKKASTVSRLWDYKYGTLFANIRLQAEMADRIGEMIHKSGTRRMSFDGMEGCLYTGHGEYAQAEFVRRVYEKTGSELLCDASNFSNYRWHAHTYANWGEPWYESTRRGGMYNYRAKNQKFFQRNLIPGMLGWYQIWEQRGRFEATSPEMMEFMLSRMVAFRAGMCIKINSLENGHLNRYLDMVRLWTEFRLSVDVPEDIRKLMRVEQSDWHLEKKAAKWVLSELTVNREVLNYRDKNTDFESGTTGYQADIREIDNKVYCESFIVVDASSPDPNEIPFIVEPFHYRIRVGTSLEKGEFFGLDFYDGLGCLEKTLGFSVTAQSGDYLEYDGGITLKHYDGNYHLLEEIQGEGSELIMDGSSIYRLTANYCLSNKDMEVGITTIRTKRRFDFPIL